MNAKKIGNTLVSFVGGVPEAVKQDIQDCLLYAELYANKEQGSETPGWLSSYQYALLNMGLTLKAYIVDQPILISNAHQVRNYKVQVAGVDNIQVLASHLGVLFDALDLERDAFSYLTQPPEASHATHYQCAPCEQTPSGDILIFVCGLQLSCTGPRNSPASSFVHLNSKGGCFQLNPTVYAARRNDINNAVRDFALTMIKDVEI